MDRGYSLDVALPEPGLAAAAIRFVLGLFGGQDQGIPPADVHTLEQDLKQLGKKIVVRI